MHGLLITHFNKIILLFHKTALYQAVINENIEIIKLLLANDKTDINALNIYKRIQNI